MSEPTSKSLDLRDARARVPLFGEPPGPPQLWDFQSGEVIETPAQAAVYLDRLRELQRDRLSREIKAAEAFLLHHMDEQGAYTLHLAGGVLAEGDTLAAAERVDWDLAVLRQGLEQTGLPEQRINEAITVTVTEKPNLSELKRIAASSPERAEVIERAQTRRPGTRRVKISPDKTGKRRPA